MKPNKKRPGRQRAVIKGDLPRVETSIDAAPAIHEYVRFSLELMMTGDVVSRARILDVKTGEDCWVEGWNEQGVIAFVRKYAGIPASSPLAETQPFQELEAAIQALSIESKSVAAAFITPADTPMQPQSRPALTLVQGDQHTVNTLLKARERWKMRFTFASPRLNEKGTRNCLIVAQAKQMGFGAYQVIADCVMPLPDAGNALEVEMQGLDTGAYRIEAGICIQGDPFEPPLQSWLEGPLIQVY